MSSLREQLLSEMSVACSAEAEEADDGGGVVTVSRCICLLTEPFDS